MDTALAPDRTSEATTVAITDSGLGGLLICAGLERRLRAVPGGPLRLVYVNAWPEAGRGYNDLADLTARAAVFDRALASIAALGPDRLVIACNTLSVVYEATAFRRAPAVPVTGILDEGTELFATALERAPSAVLALFGTRTTIGSGEHVRRLAARGIDPRRIVAEPCHGLAAAIDKDPGSPAIAGLVEECVLRAASRLPRGVPVLAGLACTHYAYAAEDFRDSLRRQTGSDVDVLDPGTRFIEGLSRGLVADRTEGPPRRTEVEVVSKVELPEAQRRAVARRLEAVSAAVASARLGYSLRPQLF
jgi:glutamate racemase